MDNRKNSYVIGIHDGHNASVCLLKEGKPIFAIQEERLRNKKNYFGFPERAIKAAIAHAQIESNDIDHVAIASNHTARPLAEGVVTEYKKQAGPRGLAASLFFATPLYELYKNSRRKERLLQIEEAGLPVQRVHFVDHHLCHASAVYYGMLKSKDEKILVLTLDGSGDNLCSTVSIAHNGNIERIAATPKGHSLGNIYSNVTFMMGFVPWEHEYKLMGMAAYADNHGFEQASNLFGSYLDMDPSNPLQFKRKIPESTSRIYQRLKHDTELMRFDAICAGLQNATEELIIKWVSACIKATGIHRLAVSGGVFMNVKANKRIMELEEVEELHIMPSCGDESNSFGAAYRCYYETSGEIPESFEHLYLGNPIENEHVSEVLKRHQEAGKNFTFQRLQSKEEQVANLLASGEVVAICQGRMEFGARALGNRSILADPINLEVVQTINMMIKKRDFWMPFAPVTTPDHIDDYMLNPKKFASPYMMLSFDTRENRRELGAAIHQADHTARFQIVDQTQNSSYFSIIKEFEKLTSRGVLLNTSFNLHGFPIVHDAEEAIGVFNDSELRYLLLGDYLVSKNS